MTRDGTTSYLLLSPLCTIGSLLVTTNSEYRFPYPTIESSICAMHGLLLTCILRPFTLSPKQKCSSFVSLTFLLYPAATNANSILSFTVAYLLASFVSFTPVGLCSLQLVLRLLLNVYQLSSSDEIARFLEDDAKRFFGYAGFWGENAGIALFGTIGGWLLMNMSLNAQSSIEVVLARMMKTRVIVPLLIHLLFGNPLRYNWTFYGLSTVGFCVYETLQTLLVDRMYNAKRSV
ncbi:hypothetical protein BT69DRAFT_1284876 [Atractiella rhizophila]|nr:hypothetical protein BT69DRAFT_1284876 [Atractiella rhizophila]